MKPPVDPVSPLLVLAVAMHEWYVALREGGFTEHEAISIVGQALRPNV